MTGASIQVSSGDEEEDVFDYEAALSPGGGEVEGDMPTLPEKEPIQAEVLPLEGEVLTQEGTPVREEVPASVEERSAQAEAFVSEEGAPAQGEASAQEEVPARAKGTSGREEASTQMVVGASTVVQAPPAEDTPLSPPARIKKRLVETTIQNFESLLSESVQMVLDGSGSFGELMPALQMYVDNLVVLMGTGAASAFQRRLGSAEKGIQELLALQCKSLLEMAFEREQHALRQRQQSVDNLKAAEAELVQAVEHISAEGKVVDEEHQKAESLLAEIDESIAVAKRTIAELQAVLVTKASVREQALKRLEELESQQQLIIVDFEEKDKALKEARSRLQSIISLTEEGLRQQIMADLERDHHKALQEAESRLRGF